MDNNLGITEESVTIHVNVPVSKVGTIIQIFFGLGFDNITLSKEGLNKANTIESVHIEQKQKHAGGRPKKPAEPKILYDPQTDPDRKI